MADHKSEIKFLQLCLKEIEMKVALGDSSEWKNSHFELLSKKIYEETNVRLSAVTLKRLWGKVAYDSTPSFTTLDTLANFIGYGNWIGYQQGMVNSSSKPEISKFQLPKFRREKIKYFLFFTLLITISLLAIIQIGHPVNYHSASFNFQPVTEGLPNTVTFIYSVEGTNADSMFIQQSWDPKLRHRLQENYNHLATTYYYPGSYRAKLILNDRIVSEKDLFIRSNGWLGTIQREPIPFYFTEEELLKQDRIQFEEEDLIQKGYDLNKEIPYTNFHLVGEFGEIDGENFNIQTRFKNTFGKGAGVCQNSQFFILGGDTPIIIPFSIKGCIGELAMYLPGKKLDGSQYDLSDFGVDFSEWVNLEVDVSDKLLKIYINELLIFEESMSVLPEKVIGIQYRFHGTGAVQSLIVSSENQIKYLSRF